MSTTAHALSNRLSALSDANKQTLTLVQRLAKLSFQPGSTPLEGDEGDVRVELTAEIHEGLKAQEGEFELLRQEVEDLIASGGVNLSIRGGDKRRGSGERERERVRISVQAARLGEDLKSARSQFRKAQIQAKRNVEIAKQKEREILFAGIQEGSSTPTAGRRRGGEKLTGDELVVNASSDVTGALRQTQRLMQTELDRSRFAQETLELSTAVLTDLSNKYSDLDSLLSSSKTLLSSLLRSQKSDTWYLETSFYVLVTTICWLVFRRFLYGPLWWFAWIPLKLIWKTVFLIFSAVGLTGAVSTSSASTVGTPPSSSRTLIVQPSATGEIPKIPRMSGQHPNINIPVGGGGYGAKVRPGEGDPSPQGSMSQRVGQMAEASQQQQAQQAGEEVKEEVRRGDGTILEESDKPRNPKKRMWDETVEQEKAKAEAEGNEKEGLRKRDEL
ncbi:hypothetical protein K402DRAFT_460912 [Aulographum hederae CBS 113979]|uniref:Sec20 C-terminal domain-containing protein n=1 Tax=Aulographum hederae CBS 113979 TaxID=1176131 RepID=A0A6G1H971_9PEZI|nr:hypothetical protein K402DRAFT_460912 [Aulographum hederae CBS 113979]